MTRTECVQAIAAAVVAWLDERPCRVAQIHVAAGQLGVVATPDRDDVRDDPDGRAEWFLVKLIDGEVPADLDHDGVVDRIRTRLDEGTQHMKDHHPLPN